MIITLLKINDQLLSESGWLHDPPAKIRFLEGSENVTFRDIGGSSVLHVTGGLTALVLLIFLSRRKAVDPDMEQSSVRFVSRF